MSRDAEAARLASSFEQFCAMNRDHVQYLAESISLCAIDPAVKSPQQLRPRQPGEPEWSDRLQEMINYLKGATSNYVNQENVFSTGNSTQELA